jgi:cytochrome c oxidase subunit II
MRPRLPRIRTAVLLTAVTLLAAACGWSGWETPMTTVLPKSDFGEMTHGLFMLISWWSLAIFLVVEAVLLYACWRFRAKPGDGLPRQIHGHTPLEISWTVAFALILLVFAVPTIRVIFKTQEAPAAEALRVDVVGKQWWWQFSYPGLNVVTANEVHIPAGRPVTFALHGLDVIHSFWVPQLGGKRDVVPGRVNRIHLTAQTPGEYPGQCAEYCGRSHANMRFRVIVHSPEDFDRWVAAQQAPPTEPEDALAQQGKGIFTQSACVGCHAVTGVASGRLGPDLSHFGSRTTLGAGLAPNTPENLARWVENPEAMKPGVLMPNLGLSREQARAVAAYLLSLK